MNLQAKRQVFRGRKDRHFYRSTLTPEQKLQRATRQSLQVANPASLRKSKRARKAEQRSALHRARTAIAYSALKAMGRVMHPTARS